MTTSTTIGSNAAIQGGFPEFMPPPSPSGISAAGRAASAAQYPLLVTDGDTGTLAALESAISKTVYKIKYTKSDGTTPIYLVLFT